MTIEDIPKIHLDYIKSTNYYRSCTELIKEVNDNYSSFYPEGEISYNGLITSFYSEIRRSLEEIDKNPYKFLKSDSKVIRDYVRFLIKNS